MAALRAAARVEAVPALVAEAVPLQALVHLALGQRQAHWALHALIGARRGSGAAADVLERQDGARNLHNISASFCGAHTPTKLTFSWIC